MDTALLSDQNQVTGRDRGYSVGDDYSDLILEVTGGSSEQEMIVQNLDSWTSGAISTLSAQAESGTSWSEQEIKEKNDSQRLESIRKLEVNKCFTYNISVFITLDYRMKRNVKQ
jgi:hypothetical protein